MILPPSGEKEAQETITLVHFLPHASGRQSYVHRTELSNIDSKTLLSLNKKMNYIGLPETREGSEQ